jgi:hypothetical protein
MGTAERVFCLPIGLTVEVGQVVASHDGYHCVDIGGRNVGLSLFNPQLTAEKQGETLRAQAG